MGGAPTLLRLPLPWPGAQRQHVPHLSNGGSLWGGPPKSPVGTLFSCLTREPQRGPGARHLSPPGEDWPAAPRPSDVPFPCECCDSPQGASARGSLASRAPRCFERNLEPNNHHGCVLIFHASSLHLASGTPAPQCSGRTPRCARCVPSHEQARRQRRETPRGPGHLQGGRERPSGHGLCME